MPGLRAAKSRPRRPSAGPAMQVQADPCAGPERIAPSDAW
jgi:hypothetical protein